MYTLKIYNSFFWGVAFRKIDEIRNIQIEEYLDSFDLLNLDIDYYEDLNGVLNCSWLKEFQKIQLIETGIQDNIIFEWFIYTLKPNFKSVKITARDFKGLLDAKVLFTDKTYTDKTLDFILNDLITDLNSRSSGDIFPETWTHEIDSNIGWITKEFKKGISYFNIFKELWIIAEKEWTTKQGKILFKEILWTDKTSGDFFTELIYNKDTPDENNISDIQVESFWTLKNVILTSTTSVNNSNSIENYGRLEEYNNIEGTELDNYLTKNSKPQKKYTFEIDYSKINTEVQIGDKLRVEINTWVEFLDISGDLFITKRKLQILGNSNVIISIDVSDITIKPGNNFIFTLNTLQDQVKKLLL